MSINFLSPSSPGVRERSWGGVAIGGARQGLGGSGLRPSPRTGGPHVRDTLRVHSEQDIEGPSRVPERSVPGTQRSERRKHIIYCFINNAI